MLATGKGKIEVSRNARIKVTGQSLHAQSTDSGNNRHCCIDSGRSSQVDTQPLGRLSDDARARRRWLSSVRGVLGRGRGPRAGARRWRQSPATIGAGGGGEGKGLGVPPRGSGAAAKADTPRGARGPGAASRWGAAPGEAAQWARSSPPPHPPHGDGGQEAERNPWLRRPYGAAPATVAATAMAKSRRDGSRGRSTPGSAPGAGAGVRCRKTPGSSFQHILMILPGY